MTQQSVVRPFREVTGVYVLYSVTTGNYYIGSSSADVWTRVSDYTQTGYQTSRANNPIVRAIFKHGIGAFLVLLLSTASGKDVRIDEQSAINLYGPAYNQLKLVGNSLGYNHSSATNKLLSTIMTGTVRSESSKRKQGITITGSGNHRHGVKLTDEQKQHLRNIALARPKSNKPCKAIIVWQTTTSTNTEYHLIRKADQAEPYSRPMLTAALNNTTAIPGVMVY